MVWMFVFLANDWSSSGNVLLISTPRSTSADTGKNNRIVLGVKKLTFYTFNREKLKMSAT